MPSDSQTTDSTVPDLEETPKTTSVETPAMAQGTGTGISESPEAATSIADEAIEPNPILSPPTLRAIREGHEAQNATEAALRQRAQVMEPLPTPFYSLLW